MTHILSEKNAALENILFQEQDRLVLWGPVFFSLGIGLYFSQPEEPQLWPFITFCMVLAALLAFFWRYFLLRLLLLSLLLCGGGFSVARFRTLELDTPMLEKALTPRLITGRVTDVRHHSTGQLHLVIDAPEIDRGPVMHKLRIRVNRFDEIPSPGDLVRLKAGLLPPPPPTMPGDFDYARHIWFQGIGAVGYGVTQPVILERTPETFWQVNGRRVAMAIRIRQTLEGDAGGLAAALITGKRDGISDDAAENMRNSGLAHLLAISGLHMGLLCGAAFFFIRFLLSRSEYLALHYPLKKISAVVAIGAGGVYLMLSGGGIPTVRAFIMACILFLGILTDRRAISLRLVAIAAMVILVSTPEALLSVSFQMSFAAVVALVAAYETVGSRWTIHKSQSLPRKFWLFIVASLFTTLVAELAIAPFALFHFNKLVQYGLLANLLAMPIMAFWVMPCVVAYLVLAPLGLGDLALHAMSYGLEAILYIAESVSHAPGSYRLIPAIAMPSLVLIVMGALWVCIWRRKWRLGGLPIILAGVMVAFLTVQPDILIDNKGKLIGVRDADDALSLSNLRAGRMVRERWAQRAGQEIAEKWQGVVQEDGWINCDRLSCLYRPIYRSPETLIALIKDEQALPEDCQNAHVVISLVPVNIFCPSARLVIDKWDIYHKGGHALWLPEKSGDWITVRTVAGERGNRPWTGKVP